MIINTNPLDPRVGEFMGVPGGVRLKLVADGGTSLHKAISGSVGVGDPNIFACLSDH